VNIPEVYDPFGNRLLMAEAGVLGFHWLNDLIQKMPFLFFE
jgi:hypothetical protein